ncbi:MAG: squalene/phytoene synthase family protein [Asticcacaulis sp.]
MTASEVLPENEDVTLACAFIDDPAKRADVLALYAFLETLRAIPDRVNTPLMGEIRLRWWYEAIEEIAQGRSVRYHPLTEVLKDLIPRYALDPDAFLAMIEGQMPLLDKVSLTTADAMKAADSGEGTVARQAAQILEPGTPLTLVEPARFFGMARLRLKPGIADAGEAELNHLRREARNAAKGLPAKLMPLVLPAALAGRLWRGRPHGPFGKRLKLFASFVTGRI